MKREPRLQFSDADLAEPKLKKPIKRVKKAEAKADKAQAKIPKKTVVKKERGFDPATGKVKTQLRFEEVDKKKPPSKLTHAVQDAPANLILSQVHREVRQSEDDNVGVEAAHKMEQTVESGGRLVQSAHRAHQLKPYRAAIRAEKKLERANLDALQKKAEIDSPTSNPVSKWQQKQAIKKQYAAAKHNQAAQTTAKAAENTAKAAKKAAEKAEKAGKYVWEHRRGFAIAAAILLMLAFLLNGLSSCSVIMDGVGSGIAASTYPSQDTDMLGAEAQYCEMEAELQRYLDTYESTHDYDEYHFDLDTIEHDPYVLISMITALHQGEWTLDEVQGTLQMLFDRQYILTEDVVVETRYRTETDTWTDADGNTHTDTYQVPYDYYICTVTLENFNLSHVPVYIMSEEQLGMYATYMATLGNRPDLFPGSGYIGKYVEGSYTDYDIPPEALDDEVFAAIIKEAEKSAAKREEVQIDKPTKSKGEIIVEQALAEPSEKKDNANENPDVAKTDKSPQSRQDSDKADMRTDKGNIKSAEKKPSVREKLERYKAAGQKKEAERYQPEHTQERKTPAKSRQTKHTQPKKKYKAKHNRPKER